MLVAVVVAVVTMRNVLTRMVNTQPPLPRIIKMANMDEDKLTLNVKKTRSLFICERAWKKLPGSVMLMTRFTRVTP